jgi:transcriptional regulator GlxA family with amidase domain
MIRIAIFVCPQTVCSSLSLTCDTFALANQLAGQRLFDVQPGWTQRATALRTDQY